MRTHHAFSPYFFVAVLWAAFIAIVWIALAGCAAIPRAQNISDSTAHLIASDPDVNHDAVIAAIANRYFENVQVDTSLTSRQIASRLDPFSCYVTRKHYDNDQLEYNDQAYRYGLQYDITLGHVVIVGVFDGSSAEDAGVLPGDEIVAISNSLINGRIYLVPKLFEPDEVRLQLYRASTRKTIRVDLKRQLMPVPSVPMYCKLDSKTGYVAMTGFHNGTATKLEKAIHLLVRHGMESLVIDLRGNPGGFLQEALQAVNLFVQHDGPILTRMSVHAKAVGADLLPISASFPLLPLAVLVDNNSCSASEIFAGIMQDLHRAIIIGEPTMGKALVMNYIPLPNGDNLYLTVSKYLLPSGRCVQRPYKGDTLLGGTDRVFENGENFDHAVDSQIGGGECVAFHATGGTPVFGCEGIIPDVFVSECYGREHPAWLDSALREIEISFLQHNAGWLNETTIDSFDRYFSVPENIVEAVMQRVRILDTSFCKLVTARVAWEVPAIFKCYVATNVWGDRGSFGTWGRHTAIIRRAIGLLKPPAELALK
jgi:carboxyl-terminal processing protease